MSGLKGLCIHEYPLPSSRFINHSQYPKELQEMLLGELQPLYWKTWNSQKLPSL